MAVAVLLLSTGATTFYFSQKVKNAYETILKKNVAQERAISHMQDAAKDEIRHLSKLSMPQGTDKYYEEIFKKIEESRASYVRNEKELSTALDSEDQLKTFAELSKTWKTLNSSIDEMLSLFKMNAKNPDRAKLIQIYYSDLEENIDVMFGLGQKMERIIQATAQISENEAAHAAITGTKFTLATVCLGFLLACVLGIVLSSYISRNLIQVAEELREQARSMIQVSDVLIAGGENVRQRTQKQLNSIEKTMQTASEINNMISQNANNAKKSTLKSKESQATVESVRLGIDNLNGAILQINSSTKSIVSQIQESHKQMHNVVDLIKEISTKTQVINEIVFQTKLLSFNASVEAARAGESGKGFSVVAHEIGKLAKSSGAAADEINEMLNRSVRVVEDMVSETEQKVNDMLKSSEKNAAEGESFSVKVGDLFKSVEDSMLEVLSCMGEISVATSEEARGLIEIQESFTEVEQLATENAGVTVSFESQAVALNKQSTSVMSVVNKLLDIVKSTDNAA
jgi:methyl-accepting chemotaxis protein